MGSQASSGSALPHPSQGYRWQTDQQLGRLEKVCEHLHLPVQAGSNNVLRRMNRRYTREYYLEIVEKVRQEGAGNQLDHRHHG